LIENIFDSPKLARKLKIKHCIDCVGTVIVNISNVPKILKEKKLEKGEIIARYSCPFRALKWHDKRNITMASTYHSADTQRVRDKSKETEKTV
jgi:siroheme synthase (precorrin-2 oxidase/ferrochelatase)